MLSKEDQERFQQPVQCIWEAENGSCTVAEPSDTTPCIFINLVTWNCRLHAETAKLAALGYKVAKMKKEEQHVKIDIATPDATQIAAMRIIAGCNESILSSHGKTLGKTMEGIDIK